MNANFYLRIGAKMRYNHLQLDTVQATKTKPATTEKEIVVKLNLEIPDEVFEEPTYEATLVMPKALNKFPEKSEVCKAVGQELSKQMGFKVRLEMPEDRP